MRDDHGRFLPGARANPNGRPKKARKTPVTDAFLAALAEDGGDPHAALVKLCKPYIDAAKKGDVDAMKLICDRLQGKLPQTIIHDAADSDAMDDLITRFAGASIYPRSGEDAA